MKKRLFAVALVVSFYVIFVIAFTGIENQEKVAQTFTDFGLSNIAAIASTPLNQSESGSGPAIKASFRDPMPPPIKKPKPRRKKRERR